MSKRLAHMKKSALITLIAVVCLGLSGCGGGVSKNSNTTQNSASTATLTSVTVGVSNSATSVATGQTMQLVATGKYSDGSSGDLTSQVTWKTSDSTLATTNSSGLLTGVKQGAVTVSATQGAITGTMTIQVTQAALSSISVTGGASLTAGSSEQLSAKGTLSDTSTQDITSQATWQSSDSTIATVSAAGLLTSLKAGTVTITASSSGVSGTASVTITPAVLTAINVGVPSPSLAAGATEQLSATGVYSDSSTQNLTNQVTWQSSDATVASLNSGGLLTALKKGSITVTASFNSISGAGTVTVGSAPLSSISINPVAFSIASGQSKQLFVQAVYGDGTAQDVTSQVTWNSDTPAAAAVDSNGRVTGASAGTSTITATFALKQAQAAATVTSAQLQSITVTPATASVATGQTQSFTASGIFSDGSTTDITNSVNWNSNATNVATIDPTGLATGTSAGSANITASSGILKSSPAVLAVTSAVLTEIDISPDGQYIPVGGQYPLTLTGTYSDGTTQTITNATWSSSDTTLAAVDNTGNVSGVANSNNNPVTITAAYGGMTNTTTVYITSATPASLQLTPATASIASGTTLQYSVNAVYTDGSIQPVTSGLTWQSSSASVAGVSANGQATALAPGQATVTVTYDSMTATASLTVTPATLTNIVVTPASTVVGINGNAQFAATGVFSDNSTQDMTSQVVWASSNAASALISASGNASGISAGTTTITATYGAVGGSATLTITTAKLQSITINPSNPIVPPQSKIQLTAIGNFSDGSTLVLSGVSWRTSTGRYGTVSGNGVLRTKKSSNKTVTVYATLNGVTGQTSVAITSMTLQTLTITPSPAKMALGTNLAFTLTGTFSDGVTQVDLTPSARWQTSNYQDAVINRQGVTTGVAVGTVTVSATVNGLSPATASLTVSNPTLQSVTVKPATQTIALGSMQQFTATGLFSDGSTQDITSVSTWTSSSPTVAVVNQSGVASSALHGQTTITATFHGISGSASLSVN
jgi:uncharacterized protein YjdB